MPFSSKAMVDEQEFLDLIDQLRVAIPEELRQAKRLTQDRDRVLAEAKAEAEKILRHAQEQAQYMLQETELMKLAEQRADEIEREAESRADEIRLGAEAYAREVLENLEGELDRTLRTVRKGRLMLSPRGRDTAEPDESL